MATDWRGLVRKIEPRARTTAPATPQQIAKAEQAVGATFPPDLRELLLQTNGIQDDSFGPVLPVSAKPTTPFVDGLGKAPAKGPLLAHGYCIEQYTLLQRSLWRDDAGVDHPTFVVVGVDIGGEPFGFFAGDDAAVRIRCIAHDEGSIGDEVWGLAEYLKHYLTEHPWFDKAT